MHLLGRPPVEAQDARERADEASAPEPATDAADSVGFEGGDEIGFGADEAGSGDGSHNAPERLGTSPRSPWTLSGVARMSSAVRLENQAGSSHVAKLRQGLSARIEYKHGLGRGAAIELVASGRAEADFAVLMQRDQYDAATFAAYAWRVLPWESYLKLRLARLELATGYQVVTLGQGEVLSTLDIVNPRDLREPLLGELDDLRMPVLMSRATLSLGTGWSAEAIVVHQAYFGLMPGPLGEFSPFRKLLLDEPTIGPALEGRTMRYRHEPGRQPFEVGISQVHARLRWSMEGLDLAFQASSLLDGVGVPTLPQPSAFAARTIELPVYHPRYTMLGASGTMPWGPVLLRVESAADIHRTVAFRRYDSQFLELLPERRNIVKGMLGLTYVRSVTTSASLELVRAVLTAERRSARDQRAKPLLPVEAPQLALRLNHSFWEERCTFSFVAILIGIADFNGFVARAELGYALSDTLQLSLGATTFQPSSEFGLLYGFRGHDRAFFNVRWQLAPN